MMNEQYLILAGLWIIYFALHSVFAATSLKKYFYDHLSNTLRSYLIVYSFIATIGLIAVVLYVFVNTDLQDHRKLNCTSFEDQL
ncbi:MAG: hypothetical protein IH947_13015 [Bacteroidetes bacterium]|nr:hypothetical protein [Bacteroidota bacterium]